jgi:DNA-binding SARP family transcriptional activator
MALMAAYSGEGQRQLAARTYSRCWASLAELGLEPSVVLERAYQAMKHHGVDIARSPELARPAVERPADIDHGPLTGPDAAFTEPSALRRFAIS